MANNRTGVGGAPQGLQYACVWMSYALLWYVTSNTQHMLAVPLKDYNVRVRTSSALVGHATYNTQHMNALPVVNTHAPCNNMQCEEATHLFSSADYGM